MICYLDTSLALHALLPTGDDRAARWLDATSAAGDIFSSRLLELELLRVLRREGLDRELARAVTDRVNLVSVDDALLRVAASIGPHVKSLDSLHLATCLLLQNTVTVATHDAAMKQAASELGFGVIDPIGKAAR